MPLYFCLTIHQLLVTVYNFEGFPCLTNEDATCMLTDKRNSYMYVHENGCIKDIDMHNRQLICFLISRLTFCNLLK